MTLRASTILASLVLNAGVSAEEIARRSGVSLETILSPTFVSYEDGLRLWAAAEELTGDPAVGLRGGARTTLDQLGVLLSVFVHATDVRDALERLARVLPLAIRPATIEVRDEPGGAVFRYVSASTARHGVDAMLSAMLVVLRECTGRPIVPSRVCFQAPPPPSVAPYEALFGVRPRWSQSASELALDTGDLDAPMRGAEPGLAQLLEAHAERMLDAEPRDPFDERLRAAIVSCTAEGEASVAAVARRLGTSTRSLQRRLTQIGSSFTEKREAVLSARAEELLARDELSIEQVAARLGFASRTTFERAYRRWSGRSPASARRAAG